MKNRVLIICEEEGCSEAALETVVRDWWEEGITEANILRVIKHPPMMWVEHGGADTEEEEKVIGESLRKKREEWYLHEDKIHGKGIKKVVDIFNDLGIEKVKVKFIHKEISFSGSVINEINEGGYDTVIISEHIWDKIPGKKIDKKIEVITVPPLKS